MKRINISNKLSNVNENNKDTGGIFEKSQPARPPYK